MAQKRAQKMANYHNITKKGRVKKKCYYYYYYITTYILLQLRYYLLFFEKR